jgi:nitroreductase
MNQLTVDQVLTTTRTVRRRLDLSRPVDIGLVKECLEIALQAPTGSNKQDWHWIVISDPEVKAAIGEYYRRGFEEYYAAHPVVSRPPSGDADRDLVRGRMVHNRGNAAYLAERIGQVPVLVVACLQLESGRLPEGNQATVWSSLLPAVWSYMLAARERGLGTALTCAHLDYEEEVAALLGLPPTVRQGALIPTAYYTGDAFAPARREPLEKVLHLDRW